jgi:hypothetical protein
MKRLLPPQTARARRVGALCGLLVAMMSGMALAQTGNSSESSATPAEQSGKDDMPPPGACKPIGLTVSGEVVFPFECRDFIQKILNRRSPETKPEAAASDVKAAAPEAKPAPTEATPAEAKPVEDKSAAADAKPAAPEAKPAAETKPAPFEERPTGSTDRPAIAEEKPAAIEAGSAPAEAVKPATPEAKSVTTEEKPVAKQSADVGPDDGKPAAKPTDTVPLPKRVDNRPHERSAGPRGCVHFRTYNAADGTYRDFSGRTRPCR